MKIVGLFFLFLLLAGPCPLAFAHTQIMTETQTLDFGRFAMQDNNAAYGVIMSPMGVETYDPHILPFSAGRQAIFELTDFAPSTLLGVSIADTTLMSMVDPMDYFDLVSFTFNPAAPTTNGAGNVTLNIGATLRTSGTGVLYTDDTYTGTYTLVVVY